MLEEMVWVFSHTASHWLLWVQRTGTELSQRLLVNKRLKVFFLEHLNFLNFMRSAEAVKEIHERNTRFKRRQMRHARQVHNLLD